MGIVVSEHNDGDDDRTDQHMNEPSPLKFTVLISDYFKLQSNQAHDLPHERPHADTDVRIPGDLELQPNQAHNSTNPTPTKNVDSYKSICEHC